MPKRSTALKALAFLLALGGVALAADSVQLFQGTADVSSSNPLPITCISGCGAGGGAVNITQFGGSNVATGTGAGGAGIPRVTVSNDSTVGIVAGSAIIGKVGIDQTTPGTTNGVQVNAALPAGGNTIGAVTQASGPWTVTGSGTAGAAAAGVVTVQGIASMTKLLVTPDSVALPANQSVNVSQFGGSNAVTGTGASGSGIPRVTVSNDSVVGLAAGSNTIGNVGLAPQTSGGASLLSKQVANNTTSFAVDASAGQLYGIEAFNNSSTIAYVKLYNASQGSTTCGSGTPVYRGMIPAASVGGGGYISMNTNGTPFSTAITACVTTGFADNDTTAPAASTYIVNFFYK